MPLGVRHKEENMNRARKTWKFSIAAVLMLTWMFAVTAFASGLSDDNSLSSLGLHNGTAQQEFVYSTWEYDVVVEPGTTELLLEPTTSNPNATITSITGTVLQDGQATVLINVESESGIPMTYTLHVTEGDTVRGESESETETQTEPQTEQTEQQTEPQTEQQTESAANDTTVQLLQAQVDRLKENTDLTMKIIYGLIALAVVLLFVIINLILKNRDLKDDLKDSENQLAYQTNEFARKEKSMDSENYYAPVQQDQAPKPVREEAEKTSPQVEEAFGNASEPKGETEDPAKKEGKDVDVTMVDL